MRKSSATQTTETAPVLGSTLKVVHSSIHPDKAPSRTIAGTPTLPPPRAHYSSSYTKDGPGGNYQGF